MYFSGRPRFESLVAGSRERGRPAARLRHSRSGVALQRLAVTGPGPIHQDLGGNGEKNEANERSADQLLLLLRQTMTYEGFSNPAIGIETVISNLSTTYNVYVDI